MDVNDDDGDVGKEWKGEMERERATEWGFIRRCVAKCRTNRSSLA